MHYDRLTIFEFYEYIKSTCDFIQNNFKCFFIYENKIALLISDGNEQYISTLRTILQSTYGLRWITSLNKVNASVREDRLLAMYEVFEVTDEALGLYRIKNNT